MLFAKGHVPWNKGKKCSYLNGNTNGFKKGQVSLNKGKKASKETIKKLSESHKGQKAWNKGKKTGYLTHTPGNIKKMLRRNGKSSLEKKFEEIVIKNKLPYRFVGNGDVLIGRKSPDFINVNGEKIAVEVFYRKHKEQFRNGGLESWKASRKKLFAEYGWKLLFFNESQVTEKNLVQKLDHGGD